MAKYLFFTDRRVGSAEALRLGIFQEVYPDSQLHEQAMDLARRIAAGPRHALRIFKANLDDAGGTHGLDFQHGLDNEARRFQQFWQNSEAVADFREAARAFVE